MAFVIQPVARDVFDSFWTPGLKREISKFVHAVDGSAQEFQHQTWAIDEGTKACLLPVSLADKLDAAWCYAFVMNGEFAVVRQEGYCVYSFVSISPGLKDRIDGVKRLIAEALRVGGEFLDGKSGDDGLFAVPDALFIPLVEPWRLECGQPVSGDNTLLDGKQLLTPAAESPSSSTPGGNTQSAGRASR
jgi:hypothetical protein